MRGCLFRAVILIPRVVCFLTLQGDEYLCPPCRRRIFDKVKSKWIVCFPVILIFWSDFSWCWTCAGRTDI